MAKTDKKSKNPNREAEEKQQDKAKVKEGHNLLGSPTFEKLDNGRFKCVETGHETLDKDKASYINSKQCRLGLIDAALSQKKPPLNMFKQDPHCRLKVVCKLTGDIVNKSEEHIWKHINGKRFLNKLEQKEAEKSAPQKMEVEKVEEKSKKGSKVSDNGEKKDKKKKDKKKKDKKKKDKSIEVEINAMREGEASDKDSDLEEPDFWAPPVGSRWDYDNGRDPWGSDESGDASDDENKIEGPDGENGVESGELTMRTKRMSIAVGPSSFASRKKKSKTSSSSGDPSIA